MSRFENRTLTLRDVSEASGVSEMTVSRVLRGRGDVSQATREKVLLAAKSLGYVPNKIAGALASQRVNLVSVIIPSMSNMVFPEVLTGINSVLENTELQPVVGVTDYLPEKEEKVLLEKSEEYKTKIEERLAKAYTKIRTNVKNGLAVVPIERGASGGSYFTIPPQVQVEIASRKKIITDEHSGRILVDAELAEEQKVKMEKLFSTM